MYDRHGAVEVSPPHFYKMAWDTSDRSGTEVIGNVAIITPHLDLTIYGVEMDSIYEEDQPTLRSARKRGYVFGCWFSEACPEGELGSNHISNLSEISRTEFEAAEKAGWPK